MKSQGAVPSFLEVYTPLRFYSRDDKIRDWLDQALTLNNSGTEKVGTGAIGQRVHRNISDMKSKTLCSKSCSAWYRELGRKAHTTFI